MVAKISGTKKERTYRGMELKEIEGDLFSVPKKYYLAQSISRDCVLYRRIEYEFQRRFKLRKRLMEHDGINIDNCIRIGRVFTLINKEPGQKRPTYKSTVNAFVSLRELIIKENVEFLAMPKISCDSHEGLKWDLVKNIIYENLGDLDIEVSVYYTD